jgi:hypothetical protein
LSSTFRVFASPEVCHSIGNWLAAISGMLAPVSSDPLAESTENVPVPPPTPGSVVPPSRGEEG